MALHKIYKVEQKVLRNNWAIDLDTPNRARLFLKQRNPLNKEKGPNKMI